MLFWFQRRDEEGRAFSLAIRECSTLNLKPSGAIKHTKAPESEALADNSICILLGAV